jgi:hypothetical protein
MKHSQLLKFGPMLVILPLLYLSGCSNIGNQAMQNNSPNSGPQASSSQTQTSNDEQTAAKQGLETLKKLVDAENYKAMGFESADEVKNATLGAPVKVFLVRLDQLREYQNGSDPNKLLTDINRTVFPVLVRDQVKSSIAVEGQNGKWSAVSFGDADWIKKVAQTIPTPQPATPVIVHVAFLNTYFVGQRVNNKLTLTNVTPLPNTRFSEQVTMPAEEVFSLLVPIAKEYNGLPM